MKIELKNVKIAANLSRETTAFTATVYVDGKRAFLASNEGSGGSNLYEPLPGKTGSETYPIVREAEAYAASLPRRVAKLSGSEVFEYQPDLDTLVGDLLEKYELAREVKRALRGKTIIEKDGKLLSLRAKPDAVVRSRLASTHPDWRIVNDLPVEEAAEVLFEN